MVFRIPMGLLLVPAIWLPGFVGCGNSVSNSDTTGSAQDGGETGSGQSNADTSSATTTGSPSDETSRATTDSTLGSTDGNSGGTSAATTEEDPESESTGLGDCRPILAEILYDVIGDINDDLQWVKIYNPCSATVELTGYALGYAGDSYVTGVKNLAGSVPAGGCYIVGGATAAAQNGDPIFDLASDFSPDLDPALVTGGGVALFDVPAEELTVKSVPLDAVIYGPNNNDALVDATGQTLKEPHVEHPPDGGTIVRSSADATWVTTDAPTPNICPKF